MVAINHTGVSGETWSQVSHGSQCAGRKNSFDTAAGQPGSTQHAAARPRNSAKWKKISICSERRRLCELPANRAIRQDIRIFVIAYSLWYTLFIPLRLTSNSECASTVLRKRSSGPRAITHEHTIFEFRPSPPPAQLDTVTLHVHHYSMYHVSNGTFSFFLHRLFH